jgi:hypothetical protein
MLDHRKVSDDLSKGLAVNLQDIINGVQSGLVLRWIPRSIHQVKGDPGRHLYLDRQRLEGSIEAAVVQAVMDGVFTERDDEHVIDLTYIEL